ncbi:MAG: phosphoribosyltransferase family protein [Chitinispirillaceae bacterium]|jgi:ComF family protein
MVRTTATMAEQYLKVFSRRLVDYLFPPLCIICDRPRLPHDRWLCENCKSNLRENHERRDPCPRCGMNRKLSHCACTHEWKHPFESVYSILDFDNNVQAIMHQIKYRGKRRFTIYFGALLVNSVPQQVFDAVDACIAVPLHPNRQQKRGYNQSSLLARGIGCSPLLEGVLLRTRNTGSQTNLDRAQRLQNMEGSFAVVPEQAGKIRGKRLMLVDDIVTTGATTAAAAKALLGAGAASVRVLSVARD